MNRRKLKRKISSRGSEISFGKRNKKANQLRKAYKTQNNELVCTKGLLCATNGTNQARTEATYRFLQDINMFFEHDAIC